MWAIAKQAGIQSIKVPMTGKTVWVKVWSYRKWYRLWVAFRYDEWDI